LGVEAEGWEIGEVGATGVAGDGEGLPGAGGVGGGGDGEEEMVGINGAGGVEVDLGSEPAMRDWIVDDTGVGRSPIALQSDAGGGPEVDVGREGDEGAVGFTVDSEAAVDEFDKVVGADGAVGIGGGDVGVYGIDASPDVNANGSDQGCGSGSRGEKG